MARTRIAIVTAVALLGSACSAVAPGIATRPRAAEKFSKPLLLSMERAPETPRKAWVFLTDKPDPAQSVEISSYLEKLDRPVTDAYRAEIERTGAKVRTTSRWLNAVSVEATPETLSRVAELPFVARVEQVKGAKRENPAKTAGGSCDPHPPGSLSHPAGPNYGFSFSQLAQINVPELHRLGWTGAGVTIALLDVGFRTDHEAFVRSRIVAERDFVLGDDDVSRDPANDDDFDDGHGTMVFSVIGGFRPGQLVGPAFGADYLLAKTEDDRSETPKEEDYWVAALEWAEARGATIVSSSLGYARFDDGTEHPYASLDGQTLVISRAVNIAAQFGILVVNAVGNDGARGPGSLASPADALEGLAVGAVDAFGEIAPFSSQGPTADGRVKPDVVALGVGVWAATNERRDSYDCVDGTSFATPLIAGLAALLRQAHPEWTVQTLADALRTTASEADRPGNLYGYGLPDGLLAIDYRSEETAPILALSN